MNNILTSLAALLVICLTVLFAVPFFINWNEYRASFEAHAAQILGTKVELDGALNIHLLPIPYLSAENVRIGDSGISGNPLVKIRKVTLSVSIPPLLKGIVEAKKLTLLEPHLAINFDEAGEPLWKYSKASDSKSVETPFGIQLSPELISLKHVAVREGQLQAAVYDQQISLKRQFNLSAIEGVFSATTLSGPLQFRGQAKLNDLLGRFQISVGEKFGQGQYPLKVQLASSDTNWNSLFEGTFSPRGDQTENRDQSKITGKLATVYRASRNGSGQTGGDQVSSVVNIDRLKIIPAVEIESDVEITSKEAKFTKMLARSGNLERPQTLEGEARLSWERKLTLEAKATARWFDLDHVFSGAGQRVNPLQLINRLRTNLIAKAIYLDEITLIASAEQLDVGGGSINNFDLSVHSQQDGITIQHLKGQLPGRTLFSFEGGLKKQGQEVVLTGPMSLRGLNFRQFANWAFPERAWTSEMTQNKFLFFGEHRWLGNYGEITNVQGELGQTAWRGGIEYWGGPQEKYALTIKAGHIDAASLFGEKIKLSGLNKSLKNFSIDSLLPVTSGANTEITQTINKPKSLKPQPLIDLHILASKISFSDIDTENVEIHLQQDRKKQLHLIRARARTSNGLTLGFGDSGFRDSGLGDRDADDSTAPLTTKSVEVNRERQFYYVEAEQLPALKDLLKITELESEGLLTEPGLKLLLPLRLAGMIRQNEQAEEMRLDGMIGDSRLGLSLLFPEHVEGDEDQTITLLGGLSNQNGQILAAQIVPYLAGKAATTPQQQTMGPGELTISMSGNKKRGLSGQVDFVTKSLQVKYNGKFLFTDEKYVTDGALVLETKDADQLLTLAGINQTHPIKTTPLSAKANLSSKEEGISLDDLKISFGQKELFGKGRITNGADRTKSKFELTAESLDLSPLTTALLYGAALQDQTSRQETAEIWSRQSFNIISAINWESQLSLTVKEARLSDTIVIERAQIIGRVMPRQLSLISLAGTLYGGEFIASGDWRQQQEETAFNGEFTLQNARLEQGLLQRLALLGQGKMHLAMKASGWGKSPQELMARLSGEGRLVGEGLKIRQLTPRTITTMASNYIQSKDPELPNLDRVFDYLEDQEDLIDIAGLDIPLRIVDGKLNMRQYKLIEASTERGGNVRVQTEIDFNSARWRSDWWIVPETSKVSGKLPAVLRNYLGDLTSPQDQISQIDHADFDSSLKLRRKELKLRQLEAERAAEIKRQQQRNKPQDNNDALNRTDLPPLTGPHNQ